MLHDAYRLIFIWLVVIIISSSIIYSYVMARPNLVIINECLTVNQTKRATATATATNSSYIELMAKDPEAHVCYSLQSPSMPEEIIDLNAVAVDHARIKPSDAPSEVTFKQVHIILYGDPSAQSIYQYGRKYINKPFDRSYPHTALNKDLFTTIISKIQPNMKLQFVVEVGSFTGNSAAVMAKVLKEAHPGSFLLCIDTWLGDLNMWVNKVVFNHLAVTEDGRPTVYYQFLANTIEENLTDIILPVSMSSILGARFLQTYQFRPQVIYLDSAHEQGETLIELALYWHILRPGGVLFGDDWNWIAVRCDVKKFAYMRNLTIDHIGITWVLKKLSDA